MGLFNRSLKKVNQDIDLTRLPVHIAIVMDGNGRWAKKRGLSRSIGHKEGSSTLKKVSGYCDDLGIKYLTVFAFSTENWKRPKAEVDALMALLLDYLKNAERELGGRSIRIKVIGNPIGLSGEIQEQIKRVEKVTASNTGLQLNIALNYGGREEIVHAMKEIARDVASGKLRAQDIEEKTLSERLYTTGMPDPDLFIRSSGEQRCSNFLLWQCAYTEYWFTDTLWPDFKRDHLMQAIHDYQRRDRRFGGV